MNIELQNFSAYSVGAPEPAWSPNRDCITTNGKQWVSEEQHTIKPSGKPQDASAHHCHPGAAAPSHTANSQVQLEHSKLSELDPTSVSHYPLACGIPPIFEMLRQCHGILPAAQVQSPLCHVACRAQYLEFLGSTLYRSSQGSSRTDEPMAHEHSGEQSCDWS